MVKVLGLIINPVGRDGDMVQEVTAPPPAQVSEFGDMAVPTV